MPKKTNVSEANLQQVAQRRDEPAPKVEQATQAPAERCRIGPGATTTANACGVEPGVTCACHAQ